MTIFLYLHSRPPGRALSRAGLTSGRPLLICLVQIQFSGYGAGAGLGVRAVAGTIATSTRHRWLHFIVIPHDNNQFGWVRSAAVAAAAAEARECLRCGQAVSLVGHTREPTDGRSLSPAMCEVKRHESPLAVRALRTLAPKLDNIIRPQ